MTSEFVIIAMYAVLVGGNGAIVLNDEQVENILKIPAKEQKVGASTKSIEVYTLGKKNNFWLEKTKDNRWELRRAM